MRSGGRSSRRIARHSVFVSVVERHLEARRKLNRAQHAQAVVAERAADRRLSECFARDRARPWNGSKYSSVSGSHEIALTVKSRRRAASSIDIDGSPSTTKPLCPRPALDSRRGSPMSMCRSCRRENSGRSARPCRMARAAPAGHGPECRRPPCRAPAALVVPTLARPTRADDRAPSRRRRARVRRARAPRAQFRDRKRLGRLFVHFEIIMAKS